MNTNIKSYATICAQLVKIEMTVFKQGFLDKLINLAIWVIMSLIVTAYVMPLFGLNANFGMFQYAAMIGAGGLFTMYTSVVEFISDLEGERIINFYLTLPIPSWFVLLCKAIYYFIIYFIFTLLILPMGKLALWNQFDLTTIQYGKLLIILLVQNIFYAGFVLWAASKIPNIMQMENIWMRYIFPMWFMGGFQFSWLSLYKVMPIAAYINLLNPMIYITEAARVALLGQEGYLNFWICIGVILIFSAFCFIVGIRNLKKRLDYV